MRSNPSRQFSIATRRVVFSAPLCRTSPLHTGTWRAGISQISIQTPTGIRNASWYAPWSWGSSKPQPAPPTSTPADAAAQPSPAPPPPAPPAEPAVTSQTPELSPAGIDSPAVVGSGGGSSWYNPFSWGRSGSSGPDGSTATALPDTLPTQSNTPELSPGTLDTPPVVDHVATATTAPTLSDDMDSLLDSLTQAPVEPQSTVDISHVTEHIGYLKELGLDYGWGPTSIMQWTFEHVYIYSGWSWGVAIIAGTLLIRAVTLWPLIRTSDSQAKMASVSPFINKLRNEYMELAKSGNTQAAAAKNQRMQEVYSIIGASHMTTFKGMILQAVLGFGAFRLLRGMSALPVPGLENAGLLWITDLTVGDPYYLLPISVAGFMHLMARLGGEGGSMNSNMTPGMRAAMMYGLPGFLGVITVFQPAALQLYFLTTTIIGASITRGLRVPSVRRVLNITPLPTPEVTALWARVADGEVPLNAIRKTADGTLSVDSKFSSQKKEYIIDYQPPTVTKATAPKMPDSNNKSSTPSSVRLNLRADSKQPVHIVKRPEKSRAATPAGTANKPTSKWGSVKARISRALGGDLDETATQIARKKEAQRKQERHEREKRERRR